MKRLTKLYSQVRIVNSGCHEYLGNVNNKGYGNARYQGKSMGTHRLSWLLQKGAIPDGLMVLHTCHNPRCVNVDHLYLGTVKDNARDMVQAGRGRNGTQGRTHCIRGHEFNEKNSYTDKRGRRTCRPCHAARKLRDYHRKRLAGKEGTCS